MALIPCAEAKASYLFWRDDVCVYRAGAYLPDSAYKFVIGDYNLERKLGRDRDRVYMR